MGKRLGSLRFAEKMSAWSLGKLTTGATIKYLWAPWSLFSPSPSHRLSLFPFLWPKEKNMEKRARIRRGKDQAIIRQQENNRNSIPALIFVPIEMN